MRNQCSAYRPRGLSSFLFTESRKRRTPVWGLGEEEFSVRRNLLERGISALVIVFLCTVRVYTCLCVSLQRDT